MKTVLLIITGGIAAYKSLLLIRALRASGVRVVPVMTQSAAEFVTPLSVSALAENPVRTKLFDLEAEAKMGHIELSRSADLIVIAPATANFIAKIANGLADDLASTLVMAARAPIMIAPSMNVAMWESAATQDNMAKLSARGFLSIGPTEGDMACGEFGFGRFEEPEQIHEAIMAHLGEAPLAGKHIVVTSGPTHEPIDPVRYIANRSSGKQGTAIADALINFGANVTFITGPASAPRPDGANIVEVETAREMEAAVKSALPSDVFISAAAVADWHVEQSAEKLKKTTSGLPTLNFSENPDILKAVCESKDRPRLVIGFAAETQNVIEYATAKRARKGCDWILANDVSSKTGIMGGDHNAIHLISESGHESWPEQSKTMAAKMLAERITGEIAKW